MPASDEFELSITKALTDQLAAQLAALTPAPLTPANLALLRPEQGIYQLYERGSLVYIGSTSRTLPERLRQHLIKLSGRENVSLADIKFICLYVREDMTVLAPEVSLIASAKVAGAAPWNFNGFGNKDPGRNRDGTRMDPAHFDRLYPRRLAWLCSTVVAGAYAADDLLRALKAELPFLLRYDTKPNARVDYATATLTVPRPGMKAEDLFALLAAALPTYQITALPGYVIVYKESHQYPNAQVF